ESDRTGGVFGVRVSRGAAEALAEGAEVWKQISRAADRSGCGLAEPARVTQTAAEKLPGIVEGAQERNKRGKEARMTSREAILRDIRHNLGRSAPVTAPVPPPVRLHVPTVSIGARIER